MKHSGVGRVGAGLSTEFVVSGRMPCILRLVGLLRAGEALVFVVCVYFLCILAHGRFGACVGPEVVVGVRFLCILWSVGLAPVFVRSRRSVYVFSAFCGRPVGRGLLRAFGPRLGGLLGASLGRCWGRAGAGERSGPPFRGEGGGMDGAGEGPGCWPTPAPNAATAVEGCSKQDIRKGLLTVLLFLNRFHRFT